MLDVYNSMETDDDSGNLKVGATKRTARDLRHFGVTEGDVAALDSSDVIMTFLNQGVQILERFS
jgi:hypothetical protein